MSQKSAIPSLTWEIWSVATNGRFEEVPLPVLNGSYKPNSPVRKS